MVDLTVVWFLVAAVTGWLHHEREAVVAYLVEENRTLLAQLRGRRLLLTDDQRRRLAVRGRHVGSNPTLSAKLAFGKFGRRV